WSRGDQKFIDQRYSRRHTVRFDGGVEYAGSSSPHVIRLPYSAADAIDPEESFVAALASCHMLWFLSLAADAGYVVDGYHDHAEGWMSRNDQGKLAITRVTLRPAVEFSGDRRPGADQIRELHHRAHEECFIANSVRSEVRCEPQV
ncbi:MAG: OsmC family protein, partial [Rhodocyclaceae bacterium]|nr:OsmC family protein [Rhodocyclaceae bacterium]